jgi:hypothetical protein
MSTPIPIHIYFPSDSPLLLDNASNVNNPLILPSQSSDFSLLELCQLIFLKLQLTGPEYNFAALTSTFRLLPRFPAYSASPLPLETLLSSLLLAAPNNLQTSLDFFMIRAIFAQEDYEEASKLAALNSSAKTGRGRHSFVAPLPIAIRNKSISGANGTAPFTSPIPSTILHQTVELFDENDNFIGDLDENQQELGEESDFSSGEEENLNSSQGNNESNAGGSLSFDPCNLDLNSSAESLLDYLLISNVLSESESAPILQSFIAAHVETIAQAGELHQNQLREMKNVDKATRRKLWKVITALKTATHKLTNNVNLRASLNSPNNTGNKPSISSNPASSSSNSNKSAANTVNAVKFHSGLLPTKKSEALFPPSPAHKIPSSTATEEPSNNIGGAINNPNNSTHSTSSSVNPAANSSDNSAVAPSSALFSGAADSISFVDELGDDSDGEDFVWKQAERDALFRAREQRRIQQYTDNHSDLFGEKVAPGPSLPNPTENRLIAANSAVHSAPSFDLLSATAVLAPEEAVKSFCVRKIRRGMKQSRELKLTSEEIWNCKGPVITACHSYSDIFCVTMINERTLCISFVNDHDFIYESEIAVEIYQEINERLAQKRNKEKADIKEALTTAAKDYQDKVHRLSIAHDSPSNNINNNSNNNNNNNNNNKSNGSNNGSESRVLSPMRAPDRSSLILSTVSSFLASSAQSPRPIRAAAAVDINSIEHLFNHSTAETEAKLFDSGETPQISQVKGNSTDNQSKLSAPQATLAPIFISTVATPIPRSAADIAARRQAKIAHLTGQTEPQRIQESIEKWVIDGSMEEGRSRAKFLKSWTNLKKKPTAVLGAIRQFMDSLSNFMQKKRLDLMKKMITNPANYNNNEKANCTLEEELIKQIEKGIEVGIIAPLYSKLIETLKTTTKSSDELISHNMARLKDKDQAWFGIKSTDQSPNGWQQAIAELSRLDQCQLPSDKLYCILNTAKAIYSHHNQLCANSMLSADDFFPIFVYVCAHSSVEAAELSKQFIWGLNCRYNLNGEGGYYLTVFEAAIEYLKNINTDEKQAAQKQQ